MNTIYGNAIITIVASTNSRPADGLPGVGKIPRSRFQIVKKVQRIPLAAAFHEARLPYGDIEDSVWKSRAWTFQERQLSRRAVYFTNTVPGVSADHRPTPLMDRSRFEAQVWTLMDYIFHNLGVDDELRHDDPGIYLSSHTTTHLLGHEPVLELGRLGSSCGVPRTRVAQRHHAPPVNIVRNRKDPRDLIYDFLVSGKQHTPEEIAEYAYRAARQPARVRPINSAALYHLDDPDDGWEHHRDTDRNEHYYTHAAYPDLRFTYPATLPSQRILPHISPDGALFIARRVPARFVDMSTTAYTVAPGVDGFLQVGLNDAARSARGARRLWEHVIYHQGYRAGFLSLNVACPSVDVGSRESYALVAMSRDSIPHIAPPLDGWDTYWSTKPKQVQGLVFFNWE
ncbi:hypothetical protein MMYC01_209076 [Madurella mycetomatis]|uniref:Heterokaryon incompatibility domain-containing protein n=1 Tax=Madurella mycetomatis TaxID=100816 RepID=A0A175VWE7_9PEZI|nr:hypothetical protein MMYC01_209076 [Madurella mycetomatis]